jgi:hypothetical protein
LNILNFMLFINIVIIKRIDDNFLFEYVSILNIFL